jgi:hypothetical protein
MARVPRFNGSGSLSQVAADPGPTSAAGAGFGALAELARVGADFVKPKAIENAKIRGTEAVYRDANGQLKIDEKNVLGGELADAHNSAAYAKYLSQRSIDIRDTMTELAVQHQYNPAAFREGADAYLSLLREEEGVPALLREDVISQAEREASVRFNGLMVSEVDRTNREADVQTKAHRDTMADDYINLVMNGDTEGAAAKYAEMQALTDFRASAPYITETPAQSEAYLRGTRGAGRAALLTRRLEDLEGARSITPEERAEVQTLLDDPDIDPRTRMRLYGATQGRLQGIDGRAAADALAGTEISDAVRNFTGGSGLSGVVAAGAGWTEVTLPDGTTERREGTRAWRNNNPGNIEYGPFARSLGAVGTDGRFAVFPSYEAGRAAKEALLFESPSYRDLTINGAINRYAPPNENDTNRYSATVAEAAGVSLDTPLSELSQDQRTAVLDAMERVEGFQEGRVTTRASGPAAPDLDANRQAMTDAGISVTPGAEFFAGAFGVSDATALFSADPETPASEVLSEELIEANPVLSSMTVEQAQAWADRKAVVKSSDIAARRTQIDQIEDPEVRRIALNALNDHYNQRRRSEDASALEYEERLNAEDDTLTEREIMSDHSLSDQGQKALLSTLRKQREDQIAAAETIANLNNPEFTWDAYDSGQRNSVDAAYKMMIGDADPLSVDGQTAAAQVTLRSGFMPKSIFNAIRGAVNSGDPERMGAALEFAGQITDQMPGAMRPYGSDSEVVKALDDYRFYGEFFGSGDAAARIIENNQPENRLRRSNLSDAAREHAKDLKPSDIAQHFENSGTSVSIPDGDIQSALMGDYERMFRDHYADTGDVGLAKNRALSDVARIYGPSGINGSETIMRYPPSAFYPPVNGSQDWMAEQLGNDVSAFAYGEQDPLPDNPLELTSRAILSPFMGRTRVPADRIFVASDARTAQDVAAGRAPSYQVRFMDDDEVIQEVPGRYRFEPPAPEDRTEEIAGEVAQAEKDRNLRMWIDHYRQQGLPMNEYNSQIMSDMDMHTTTKPPGM